MSDPRSDPGDELRQRLREPELDPGAIARFLDGLTHGERVQAIRATRRSEQRRLYEAVEGLAPVRLVDLVGAKTPALSSVRHFGKNTLPAFSHFEKRFCRSEDTDPEHPGELYGFNFQALEPVTGPGYFVAVEDEKRREVLVDYRRLPPFSQERRPPGWPEVKSNERGVSRFVYGFMVDTLRRVSEHVTIGSAARRGKDMGSWFMLARDASDG